MLEIYDALQFDFLALADGRWETRKEGPCDFHLAFLNNNVGLVFHEIEHALKVNHHWVFVLH